jgi:cobyrinic acid a,c-diamide synthase
MVSGDEVTGIFVKNARQSDISIIEGNRGIYDGKDEDGKHSTAELAKLLRAPVVLVVDCTKTTRTVAAVVKGCIDFDPEVSIAGVILNKLAGDRHRKVISDSIEKYCGVPVLGAVPKFTDGESLIPGRHLGLVTPSEFGSDENLETKLLEIAESYLNINEIINMANNAESFEIKHSKDNIKTDHDVKIGYFKDSVFTFYYPENLEALRDNGAELVPISSLADSSLPDIDGLYIGGGFPETHAEDLAKNRDLMKSVNNAARNGLPIYAECGGLIYLSKSLKWKGRVYHMADLFDIDLEMNLNPVGHGYTEAEVDRTNPYYEVGAHIKGHEFHYTGPTAKIDPGSACMKIKTGTGLDGNRDGMVYRNCFASYTHIHASGANEWASSFVEVASIYKDEKQNPANEEDKDYIEAIE